jgi:hypothetical protein
MRSGTCGLSPLTKGLQESIHACRRIGNDLQAEQQRYSPMGAYARSKLADIVFAVELQYPHDLPDLRGKNPTSYWKISRISKREPP